MRQAQFVSPIIILAIIIISALLVINNEELRAELNKKQAEYSSINYELQKMQEMDLNHQNQLAKTALSLASTINSSGTLTALLAKENITKTTINEKISLEYSKKYYYNTSTRIISGTVIVPYPYTQMLEQEQRLNTEALKNCMGTTCTSFKDCTDTYDSGTFNWEPALCLTSPLRVKITVTNTLYPLTLDYPYYLMNNSLIILD